MTITAKFKLDFFDAKKVLDKVDAATRRAMSKAGAYVRTAARSSMRRRKKASAPGQPPSVHKGQLKNLLFFSYDQRTKSVVIGPVKFARGEAPNLEEFGGSATRARRVIAPRRKADPAQAAAFRRRPRTQNPIRTSVPTTNYSAKYPPRPFMGPALAKEAPKFSGLWANAVKA